MKQPGTSPWLTLEVNQWADLIEYGQIKEYKKDETIVDIGTIVDKLYYVLDGNVKYTLFHEQGQEKILALLGPGTLFGEGPIFTEHPTTLYAIASSDCRICELHYEHVMKFLRHRPELAKEIINSMSYKLQLLLDQLIDLSFQCSRGRVANLIYRLAINHGTPTAKGMVLPLELTQQELANLAGCSLKSVSRVFSALKTQKLINYSRQHLIINDLAALKNICDDDTK